MDITRYGGSSFDHIQLAPIAKNVRFDAERMYVVLADGREISVPIQWFPILAHATPEQRNNWKLAHNGIGIRWEDIDEDISVKGLLGTCD